MTRAKVILRDCDTYDAMRIREIVREGLEELQLKPTGRTLVKPNIVAAGKMFPHAFTRAKFAEGVLWALKDVSDESMTELAVGERCGITIPTRAVFFESGYERMLDRVPDVKRYYFDEEPQVEIPLRHTKRLRDYIYVPEPVAKADFYVSMPKFKAHPWTTVTFSIKLYIGIQDDRHRLIDHDHRLNEKIRDLQYVIQPQFCVMDAITAGEGRMMTPKPFPLNLVMMGNNQVAFDAVASQIIGLDPRSIDHIRYAHEEGFGPIDLADIDITGDVTLEEARVRAKGFERGLIRVEKYFEGTNITAYAGPPPESEKTDYCWGGCPGAIEEAIEILRVFDKACDSKMPRMHVVFGAYDGPIDAKPGEKVIFIGDCATWKGTIGDELVQIRSTYRDRSTLDPHHIQHDDVYAKMLRVRKSLADTKDQTHVRLHGCPVSVGDQILALAELGGVKNPYFDPRQAVGFSLAYATWRFNAALKRLDGHPYQIPGPTTRGDAAPELSPVTGHAVSTHGETDDADGWSR